RAAALDLPAAGGAGAHGRGGAPGRGQRQLRRLRRCDRRHLRGRGDVPGAGEGARGARLPGRQTIHPRIPRIDTNKNEIRKLFNPASRVPAKEEKRTCEWESEPVSEGSHAWFVGHSMARASSADRLALADLCPLVTPAR